jgi:hypothetical protein
MHAGLVFSGPMVFSGPVSNCTYIPKNTQKIDVVASGMVATKSQVGGSSVNLMSHRVILTLMPPLNLEKLGHAPPF